MLFTPKAAQLGATSSELENKKNSKQKYVLQLLHEVTLRQKRLYDIAVTERR